MTIARYFDESRHDGSFLPGVPLRDLTEDEYAALPAWLQQSVDRLPFYRKTKPGESVKPAPKADKEA